MDCRKVTYALDLSESAIVWMVSFAASLDRRDRIYAVNLLGGVYQSRRQRHCNKMRKADNVG